MRTILGLAVALGVLSSQAGAGTLAFFTSTTQTSALFTAGTLNIVTGTSLPSSSTFKWDSSGKGSQCAVISGATTGTGTERMAPNEQCTTVVTLSNSAGNITGNVRLRVIRVDTDTENAADAALNSKLTLSLAARNGAADTSACTASFNYGGTAGWDTVFNGSLIGTGGGLGVTSFATSAPLASAFDDISGGKGKDLWGGTVVADNGPDTTKQLAGGATQDFCLKIAFPSAGLPVSNTTEDNAAQAGSVTYYFRADAIQAAGR